METLKLVPAPAFPIADPDMTLPGQSTLETQGMSKRFYAACAAMQGFLSSGRFECLPWILGGLPQPEALVKYTYELADEILKQENK